MTGSASDRVSLAQAARACQSGAVAWIPDGQWLRQVREQQEHSIDGVSARSLLARRAVLLAVLAGCQQTPEQGAEGEQRQQDRYRQPERLVAALGIGPGDRVAEIGAGGGYLTLRLARAVGPSGRVLATDIDGTALSALRERAARAGLGAIIETRLVAAESPGLQPDRFDLILLAQVDHLLPDRAVYLRALLPSLREGGRVALSNAERHREGALRAAGAAGLAVREAPAGLPAQFLLIGAPGAPGDGPVQRAAASRPQDASRHRSEPASAPRGTDLSPVR